MNYQDVLDRVRDEHPFIWGLYLNLDNNGRAFLIAGVIDFIPGLKERLDYDTKGVSDGK